MSLSGRLRSINKKDAKELIEKKYLEGPIFEENIRIESGFLYNLLGINYFNPAAIFWRRVRNNAKKHNCDVAVTDHHISFVLPGIKRTYIEGAVSYYNSTKALELDF